MNLIHDMNPADSQVPGAPTHVYLLQMDSSISNPNEQMLPLHSLLNNSLEYGRNQYPQILPISTKQKDGQDQLQVLIDSCQDPTKILGLLVDRNYQDIQNQLSFSNVQPQEPSVGEYSNAEDLSVERPQPDFIKPQLNITIGNKNECKPVGTQGIQDYVHISDRIVPPRALAVLPSVLQVQRRHIIATRRTLPVRARFGPVQGIKYKITHSEAVDLVLDATSNKKPLFLIKNDDDVITHIETSDKDKSNWISLLPLGDENSANVWLYEENQELYAITTETIPSRKPLMLGYSKKYAEQYGLVGPTKHIEKVSPAQKSWWCYECQRALPSSNLLQRHMDLYHLEDTKISKRKYRCKHCSRTFSRIFSLRRHVAFNCPNKVDKRNNVINTEAEPPISLNGSMCSEDHRIPSDESFQNYSNGLDFSTNLFDTDRIPSLDISGNSRSDNDFNPYVIGYRDESGFTNDLVSPNTVENSQNTCKEKQKKSDEQLLVTCPRCNQIVVKEKRRHHISECPARRFECECKKVFTSKKLLTQHIFTQHSNDNCSNEQNDNVNPQASSIQYKCEQCQLIFKRRGMFVNHLWRVHKTVSARVPLERRVRHYPCVICPKIYRTAAKRDRHVVQHHPGAEKIRRQALEGGTRVCEPAMCSACPRQYVTRAKLLQHMRAHHRHLVPPPVTKNPPKKPKSSKAARGIRRNETTIPKELSSI